MWTGAHPRGPLAPGARIGCEVVAAAEAEETRVGRAVPLRHVCVAVRAQLSPPQAAGWIIAGRRPGLEILLLVAPVVDRELEALHQAEPGVRKVAQGAEGVQRHRGPAPGALWLEQAVEVGVVGRRVHGDRYARSVHHDPARVPLPPVGSDQSREVVSATAARPGALKAPQ